MAQKAPGKSHRKGLTLAALFRMFPDDAAAEKWFAEQRWPEGPHCPYCGSVNVQSGAKHKTMPYRCREKECAKRFSIRTKTPMESSKLGFQVWAIALYQLTTNLKSVSSMKLHRDLGITQKSAWFLAHRLREAWKDHGSEFAGPVEADETFMGGKRKNKPKDQRGGPNRTGIVDKTVVAGVRDRATNRVSAAVVPDTRMETLQTFVEDRTAPATKVYTDEHPSYRGLRRAHEAVHHRSGEYVRGEAHTQGIESFWSMLKRAHKGTFHKISAKHMQRYVNEFSGRHNIRNNDTIVQMQVSARRMVGMRLRYKELIDA